MKKNIKKDILRRIGTEQDCNSQAFYALWDSDNHENLNNGPLNKGTT